VSKCPEVWKLHAGLENPAYQFFYGSGCETRTSREQLGGKYIENGLDKSSP